MANDFKVRLEEGALRFEFEATHPGTQEGGR